MATLYNGDCFDSMKLMDDKSVDLIFCDLPYGQTSCKWDCLIDLDKLWIEFMRVKKLNTPIIMTCTTKFGLSLLNSCPKKCPFRYDLVWCKSAAAGFLCAKKMPMRKHEMIYVFYEKLPFYDLSSHKHKFVKEEVKQVKEGDIIDSKLYNTKDRKKPIIRGKENPYIPPLPTSLIKEEDETKTISNNTTYGDNIITTNPKERKNGESRYDPPLPNSLIKEDFEKEGNNVKNVYKPSFTQKENADNLYQKCGRKNNESAYDPPLPNSLIKEDNCPEPEPEPEIKDVYNATERFKNGKLTKHARNLQKGDDPIYDPALPNSLLEIKSTRGKHSTEKPVALMEWILKYYSKEGDNVFDPTMGSGSMGVACGNMNRNFIGIEKDAEIYQVAVNRIEE